MSTEIPFFNENNYSVKERLIYKIVSEYMNNLSEDNVKKLISIADRTHNISLRILDRFVTKYAKQFKISYNIKTLKHDTDINYCFNVHCSYLAYLDTYTKKIFDPFRRQEKNKVKLFRFSFEKYNIVLVTTLGQLNFFKWIFEHRILSYVELNWDTIKKELDKIGKEDDIKKEEKKSKKLSNDSKKDAKKSKNKYIDTSTLSSLTLSLE